MHFVDTTVLVYTFDESDPVKRGRAQHVMRRLWETRTGRISHQVLHEFYVTVTRKLCPVLPRQRARAEVEDLLAWNPVPSSGSILEQAWDIEDGFGLSWWDSMVAAAARHAGCATLLSEDLQHGLDLAGTRILNPFDPAFDPDSLL